MISFNRIGSIALSVIVFLILLALKCAFNSVYQGKIKHRYEL
ncbi:hypothetical protein T4A_431 [Trichinella pseudospiralis]|uniref:Uncharacterized protein n=1 Tax=Trichinella pseudospiralis TaxID=6337 RepID=A0A0V1DM67_TRIPS|nr:hypothetical protein T4A_431 [Trichinella pseudospiralis]